MVRISLEQALRLAEEHYAAGRLDDAVVVCRAVLQTTPESGPCHGLLGLIACRRQEYAAGEHHLRQAVAADPHVSLYCEALASLLTLQGRYGEAEQEARAALARGVVSAALHSNLGNALQYQGRVLEAEAAFRRAITLNPQLPDAHNNLAAMLLRRGALAEAEQAVRQALTLRPQFIEALYNRGEILLRQGRAVEADRQFRDVLALHPQHLLAHHGLAGALALQNRLDEAIDFCRAALALEPRFGPAASDMCVYLTRQHRLGEAEQAGRQAVALTPNLATAHNNLGLALLNVGLVDEARHSLRRALELDPALTAAEGNLLLAAQYAPHVAPQELLQVHQRYDARHTIGRNAGPPRGPRSASDRLRLGFVSADFRRHAAAWLFLGALEQLRHCNVDVTCYDNGWDNDDFTARCQAAADRWRHVAASDDDALARQIRDDGVEVLVDLSGFTAGNRLAVFARRPAPLQVTWLGYEGTTGMAALDALIADRHMVPPGEESCYSERVWRMPGCYACFLPPAEAPPIEPRSHGAGGVTFGSFSNLAKINPIVIATWSDLLRRVPDARLFLKYRGLEAPAVANRFRAAFAAHGIAGQRLLLAGWSGSGDYWAAHQAVDIALDTWPFSGNITTCNALWMGVPVITLPGRTFAGRHALTHLRTLGLAELIARDPPHYVELAAELAHQVGRRAEYRATLRPRIAASRLVDAPRFAREFSELVRQMWNTPS